MRIIDKQGRLFGKINLIDFLVVLFILYLVPTFYFGYKLFNKHKKVEVSKKETPTIVPSKIAYLDVYCRVRSLSLEEVKLISVGDRDNEKGKILGEILTVSKPEDDFYPIDFGYGKTVHLKNFRKIFIKVRLLGEIKDNAFFWKGERMFIGSKISFVTDKYRINCLVESAEEETKTTIGSESKPIFLPRLETMELNLTLKGLALDKAKLVTVGDVFLDDNGNKLGEVLYVSEPAVYSYTVDLGGGNIITPQDTNHRQIRIKVRLSGEVRDNAFFWKGERVAVGSKLNLKTDEYKTEATVDSEPKPIGLKMK